MNEIPISKEFEVLVGKLLRWHKPWRPLYLPNPKTGRCSTIFHSNIVLKPSELFVVLSMSDAFWKSDTFWKSEASSAVRFVCGVKILHPVVGVAWIDYVFENLSELIIVDNGGEE